MNKFYDPLEAIETKPLPVVYNNKQTFEEFKLLKDIERNRPQALTLSISDIEKEFKYREYEFSEYQERNAKKAKWHAENNFINF